MKASGVSLMPSLRGLLLELGAHVLESGDVRLVELRDVRNVDPARMQARPGDLLDARQRLGLDGAELREVDLRHAGQRAARASGSRAAAREHLLDEGLHVVVRDAALEAGARDLREIHAQLARELAHRRAGVRAREPGSLIGGRSLRAARNRGAGLRGCICGLARAAAAGAACASPCGSIAASALRPSAHRLRTPAARRLHRAAHRRRRPSASLRLSAPRPATRTVTIRSPSETLPPLVTCTFSTTPPPSKARPSSPCRSRA